MRMSIAWWLLIGPATALAGNGIHRCVGENGVSIYTDQPCERFGAVDRKPSSEPPGGRVGNAPPAAASEPAPTLLRTDCARQADTLLFELRRAIETRNVNQLAGLYHWPGTGSRAARGIVDRLEGIAKRPEASVELVFPAPPPPPVEETWMPDLGPAAYDDVTADEPPADEADAPVASEDPVGVRIEHTRPGDSYPSFAADLRLVRHAGCWWLHF